MAAGTTGKHWALTLRQTPKMEQQGPTASAQGHLGVLRVGMRSTKRRRTAGWAFSIHRNYLCKRTLDVIHVFINIVLVYKPRNLTFF